MSIVKLKHSYKKGVKKAIQQRADLLAMRKRSYGSNFAALGTFQRIIIDLN